MLQQLYTGWSGEGRAFPVQQMMGNGHLSWHDGHRAPSHSIPVPERAPRGAGANIGRAASSHGRGGPVGVWRREEDGEGFLFKR